MRALLLLLALSATLPLGCEEPPPDDALLPFEYEGDDSGQAAPDDSGDPGEPPSCAEDADCEVGCPPELLGCGCWQERCVPQCESDADCPLTHDGQEMTCAPEGHCSPPGGGPGGGGGGRS